MALFLSLRLILRREDGRLLHPWTRTTTWARTTGSSASVPGNLPTEEDLPQIKLYHMLYRMFVKGYFNRMHELQVYEKNLYGSMYKINASGFKSIALNSAELVEELLRKDEKFPSRGDMTIWTDYRDMKGLGYGPITEEGEKWYNLRTVLNKRMLHPKDSVQYGDVVNEVITDFIKRIQHLRQTSQSGTLVSNLSNELYRFSLEGISSILFETRIGCLEREIPKETQDFIDSISKMFSYSMPVFFLPKWTRQYLPFWNKYIDGWEGIFKFSRKLIHVKMEDIQQSLTKGEEVEGAYLTYLLASKALTEKDVYGSIAELMLAGVDTTSNAMMWTLYLLSSNPEAQNRLYQEVSSCLPDNKLPKAEDVVRLPYLKAVIKETLRLYPVLPTNVRIIKENGITIGGHYFPKNTIFTFCHYAIGRDENVFPEPQKFLPERWLRDSHVRPHPFGTIPFGFGVRGCAGRRIAELEMYLLLFRIMKTFEVHPDPSIGQIKGINRTVLAADRKVNMHFLERNGFTVI